ncbi:MAG: undecaprenyldiphospho-muramoylpentapeptide beta-N-acetylglucosaminyltransferase [Candidatus Gracilibacteria bacterium]|nr:undecaprenyldiphospho-muramoylpentapeptide beta-N-acetylglucosaminyltransferase [Candidatus Gracilibacteria bacterium]
MRILLTGGGTGGHVIPNLAIIEDLKSREIAEIKYVGSKKGPEKKLIEKAGIDFEGITCGKLRRYFSFENFADFFRVPVGIFQAYKILKGYQPVVIFSKGGYVSFPVVVVAWKLKIPVILHESDVVPGLANKLCMKFAKKICISFEETKLYLNKSSLKKTVFTGNPVRKSIFSGNREAGLKFTGLNQHRPVILVMGGSQGADQINKLVRSNLDELLKKFQIVHVVGRGNLDIGIHKTGYKQYEYLDENLKDVYAICDLMISRGGANSLAEMALLKKKAVVIPLSTETSRGDQIENSRVFVRKLGWSMLSGNVSKQDFIDAVFLAFNNPTKITGNEIPNGTDEIVQLILNKGE